MATMYDKLDWKYRGGRPTSRLQKIFAAAERWTERYPVCEPPSFERADAIIRKRDNAARRERRRTKKCQTNS